MSSEGRYGKALAVAAQRKCIYVADVITKMPEKIMFGLAKMLCRNEKDLKRDIGDKLYQEFCYFRDFWPTQGLDERKIEMELDKYLFMKEIPDSKLAGYAEFDAFMLEVGEECPIEEVVKKAIEVSHVNFQRLFKKQEEKVYAAKNEDRVYKKPKAREMIQKFSVESNALEAVLLEEVRGQEKAVSKFVSGYFDGQLQRKSAAKHSGPHSYFFFLGPPGVGKTLLAETVANTLKMPYRVFDMSEYATEESVQRLIGSSYVYLNTQDGLLTEFVFNNEKCILVFDEIEKAHPAVIRLFLQILGSGRITSASTQAEVCFDDAVIIFTSNVGKNLYEGQTTELSALPERVVLDSIKTDRNPNGTPVLLPELCSRIAAGNMVLFNHLKVKELLLLTERSFRKVDKEMQEGFSCSVSYDSKVPVLFLYTRGGQIDARVARRQGEKFLKNEIFHWIRSHGSSLPETDVTQIRFQVDLGTVPAELQYLFVEDAGEDVLFFVPEKMKDKLSGEIQNRTAHFVSSQEEAEAYLQNEVAAVFVDPFMGCKEEITDAKDLLHEMSSGMEVLRNSLESLPESAVFVLDTANRFSEEAKDAFLREGADGVISYNEDAVSDFTEHFEQVMEQSYLEKTSMKFSRQGFVLKYKTRVETEGDCVTIYFSDMEKEMAVDVADRGMVLGEMERPSIRFSDVIGAQNAKDRLGDFVRYLKAPKQYIKAVGKVPKGVLFYGPPGTGKTMLAKALAGETEIAFFSTSAAELMNQQTGSGAYNIKTLFRVAKKYAPSVVFIDEIDTIGKQRTGGGFSEESALNVLLTEMDGFSTDSKRPVFVVAATNFGISESKAGRTVLDEALVRRFDASIYVDLPNEAERKEFLSRAFEKKEDADIGEELAEDLAKRTTGQSLAILQNVLNNATATAAREDRALTGEDISNALEEYLFGEKSEGSPEYYARVAVHETGHAYISYLSGKRPTYITIESRGDFGGYMMEGENEVIGSLTKKEVLAKIRTALAGRAAEEVFFGRETSLNTGARSDLRKATDMALAMLCSYGMEESLVSLPVEQILASPVAERYIEKAEKLLEEEMKKTIASIEAGREIVERVAEHLKSKNHLTGDEFEAIVDAAKE